MNRWRLLAVVAVVSTVGGWVAACSDDETISVVPPGVGGTGAAGGGPGATGPGGAGGALFGGSAPQECTTSAECDGGVCVDGICCSSAENVCGQQCCTGGEACVFDQCVTPGDPCLTSADCPDEWYCEPALGEESDAGIIDAGADAHCTAPTPAAGRCLPMPPVCEGDAGAGGGCVAACEYHPPVGQLQAVRKWQWGYDPAPTEYPGRADVWSTPAVARIYDANCDGEVNIADPPQIVFVSGNSQGTCCHCDACATLPSCCQTGVLRMLDGVSGAEIWSLDKAQAGSYGFAAVSVAVGDVDGDQSLDIVALTGDGFVAVIDAWGTVRGVSSQRVERETTDAGFGWGGGVSLGDMDHDGQPEIAYGRTLFDTAPGNPITITRLWTGSHGWGRWNGQTGVSTSISYFVDLDMTGELELLAGNTAYTKAGGTLWNPTTTNQPEGFTAVGDFDDNGTPEVVLVSSGTVRLLHGATGLPFNGWAPLALTGAGHGGPPTVADFDGDGLPEIGVALQDFYSMVKPDLVNGELVEEWAQTTHDFSSSVTGSSVFDFEGDGKAEVVYNDECFLWVYDGTTGERLMVSYTQSFTATESSIVADVDGDGHAEMLIIANGANPANWHCAHHTQDQTPISPHTVPLPIWVPPQGGPNYRGITVLGDLENSWVGTRTLWNQHAYHVTNICDPRDGACLGDPYYGQIPQNEQNNWQVSWLNNFRQNVQDEGLFDAPDAVVALSVECVSPVRMQVSVRNIGLSGLPAGIEVAVFEVGPPEVLLGSVVTTIPLMPGQTEVLPFEAPAGQATTDDTFVARIVTPEPATFHECREDNNESAPVTPNCVQ